MLVYASDLVLCYHQLARRSCLGRHWILAVAQLLVRRLRWLVNTISRPAMLRVVYSWQSRALYVVCRLLHGVLNRALVVSLPLVGVM